MIRITYDPGAHAAYIYLVKPYIACVKRTVVAVENRIMLDFDSNDRLIGIEVLCAERYLNKETLREAKYPRVEDLE